MIVLRNQPNVRILENVFLYPGMNGNIPDGLAKNKSFQDEVEIGYMRIVSRGKADEEEFPGPGEHGSASGPTDRVDAIDIPDEGLIQSVLEARPAEAIKLVKGILKIATVMALAEREKRGSVVAAVSRQLESLK